MYHARFKGTHAQIGLKWGSLLKKNQVQILKNIPFPLSEERKSFARSCLPVYEVYYPEIIKEIRGITEGQEISADDLFTVLFSMYCIMPANNCSSFLVRNEHGLFLGRNSDFLTSIEKLYMNTIYRLDSESGFSFTGNTTAFVEMEDGINEFGLAAALTSVAPKKIQPGINVGMLLRMILEKCKTFKEAITLIKSIPMAGSGTLVIGDAFGSGGLIELSPEKIQVTTLDDQPYICAVNIFNSSTMKQLNQLPKDTWQAEERFSTLATYLAENHSTLTLETAQQLLAGAFGFICQYDRKTGKDTVWSSLYDLTKKAIYRVEGNPKRKTFKEDKRFLIY